MPSRLGHTATRARVTRQSGSAARVHCRRVPRRRCELVGAVVPRGTDDAILPIALARARAHEEGIVVMWTDVPVVGRRRVERRWRPAPGPEMSAPQRRPWSVTRRFVSATPAASVRGPRSRAQARKLVVECGSLGADGVDRLLLVGALPEQLPPLRLELRDGRGQLVDGILALGVRGIDELRAGGRSRSRSLPITPV